MYDLKFFPINTKELERFFDVYSCSRKTGAMGLLALSWCNFVTLMASLRPNFLVNNGMMVSVCSTIYFIIFITFCWLLKFHFHSHTCVKSDSTKTKSASKRDATNFEAPSSVNDIADNSSIMTGSNLISTSKQLNSDPAQIADLMIQCSHLEIQNSELSSSCSQLKLQLESLNNQISNDYFLKSKHERLFKDISDQHADLSSRYSSLESQNSELKSSCSQHKLKLDSLNIRVSSDYILKSDHEILVRDIQSDLKLKLNSSQHQIILLEQTNSNLKSINSSQDEKILHEFVPKIEFDNLKIAFLKSKSESEEKLKEFEREKTEFVRRQNDGGKELEFLEERLAELSVEFPSKVSPKLTPDPISNDYHDLIAGRVVIDPIKVSVQKESTGECQAETNPSLEVAGESRKPQLKRLYYSIESEKVFAENNLCSEKTQYDQQFRSLSSKIEHFHQERTEIVKLLLNYSLDKRQNIEMIFEIPDQLQSDSLGINEEPGLNEMINLIEDDELLITDDGLINENLDLVISRDNIPTSEEPINDQKLSIKSSEGYQNVVSPHSKSQKCLEGQSIKDVIIKLIERNKELVGKTQDQFSNLEMYEVKHDELRDEITVLREMIQRLETTLLQEQNYSEQAKNDLKVVINHAQEQLSNAGKQFQQMEKRFRLSEKERLKLLPDSKSYKGKRESSDLHQNFDRKLTSDLESITTDAQQNAREQKRLLLETECETLRKMNSSYAVRIIKTEEALKAREEAFDSKQREYESLGMENDNQLIDISLLQEENDQIKETVDVLRTQYQKALSNNKTLNLNMIEKMQELNELERIKKHLEHRLVSSVQSPLPSVQLIQQPPIFALSRNQRSQSYSASSDTTLSPLSFEAVNSAEGSDEGRVFTSVENEPLNTNPETSLHDELPQISRERATSQQPRLSRS